MNINLVEEFGNDIKVTKDLYGNDIVVDWRPVAGKSAQASGKLFENVVEKTFKQKSNIRSVTKNPKFKCHFGMLRKGDFEIIRDDTVIHVECKQLGNAESHFDKLSHVLMNLINGCYGKNFWLVYDYNRDGKQSTMKKIKFLEERCEQVKTQVAQQGITFEYLTIDKLCRM